jgi:glucuronoarabinoxylan endo-1,4-beta-xylanase
MSEILDRRSLMSQRAGRARIAALGVAALLTAVGLAATEQSAQAASTVTVNPATTYQTIDGFGASEAFGMSGTIRTASASVQKQALDALFSTTSGAGLTILRNIIPSDSSHSIEPNAPSGGPNGTPNYVWNASSPSVDWDQLWVAQQAKNTYGVTNFFNDAWSAPGYMKTNNSESNGGSLCGTTGASCSSGDWRQAYSNYLIQHEKYWVAAGLPPSALGFVNEPSFKTNYSSMDFSPAQVTSFVKVLGPALRSSGLKEKLVCCDPVGWNQLPSYASAIGADSTANQYVDLYTSHGYGGAPNSVVNTNGKPVWETEWSAGSGANESWDNNDAFSGFSWAQNIHNGLVNANLSAFLYWWGIDAYAGNSSLAGITNGQLTVSKRLWAFANYSRYIRPGAVRIGASTGDSNLKLSAYRNADGSIAVVVLNTAQSAITANYAVSGASGSATPYLTNNSNNAAAQATIPLSGGSFSATVPARSLVTYRIPAGGSQTTTTTTSTTSGTSTSTTTSTTTTTSRTTTSTTGGSGNGSGCTATYTLASSWDGGFVANVTVKALSAISGWRVSVTLPSGAVVTNVWNGVATGSSGTVQVSNQSYNGTLSAGGSADFGFQGTGNGAGATVSCSSG